ncbi:hypothetical protein Mpet_1676 [Methanolacinia petrolearia DSM 11571]|uniref:Uncharacterized protein n=1 Tax=Methanolacinia petrolearia (strain DSM 11571 / OCM 486 / SEBR 4847) TaxID=679926 RepID=E1RHC5_METP4|nr:hypothetical protein [Methanolacinia petrolearia]ADN36429.1 hypothetical protein Mpet_1676 [Methanolacinia petrolearia DSM 11571]
MIIDELKDLLTESLKETFVNDVHLYQNNLCERSKVFRIGLILSQKIKDNPEYSGYSVDCEYNKRGDHPKIISNKNPQSPDLMLHRRGDFPEDNLLVVEFKVLCKGFYKKGFYNDIEKLKILTKDGEYNYRLGAHVFLCSSGYIIKWYESGKDEPDFYIYSAIQEEELNKDDKRLRANKFLKEYENISLSCK